MNFAFFGADLRDGMPACSSLDPAAQIVSFARMKPAAPLSDVPKPTPREALRDERAAQRRAALKRLLRQDALREWPSYGVAVLAMVVVALCTAGTAHVMQMVIDSLTQPQGSWGSLTVAGLVASVFLVRAVATFVQTLALSRAGLRIGSRLQKQLYDRILYQSMDFFSQRQTAQLIARVQGGARAARGVVDLVLTTVARDGLTFLGLVGVMLWHHWLLALVVFLFGPVALLAVRGLLRRSRAFDDQEYRSQAELLRLMQETLAGTRVIKAFGLEGWLKATMEGTIDSVERRSARMARMHGLVAPMMDVLSGLAIGSILVIGARMARDAAEGGTAAGSLVAFVTALLMIYEPAKRLMGARVQIDRSAHGLDRLYEIIDAPNKMPEDVGDELTVTRPVALRLEDVHLTLDKAQILRGVTIDFPAGKTTAIIGPSGSGKTTILNLLIRMMDPGKGRILFNGIDIRSLAPRSLRRQLSYVSQDTFLFAATLGENIALGREGATEDEVIEAARKAHAHDFITALPRGYDTQAGENGARLSGGQRQRLAIARAFLRDAPVMLLDEATSALDAEAELAIRQALAETGPDVTRIIVAHRLSTVMSADHIVVLSRGRVVESGPVATLLDKADGVFRRMHDVQFRDLPQDRRGRRAERIDLADDTADGP